MMNFIGTELKNNPINPQNDLQSKVLSTEQTSRLNCDRFSAIWFSSDTIYCKTEQLVPLYKHTK